jgi:predicted MFS family arabinose efflux permease
LISALVTIAVVVSASYLFPNPRELEVGHGLETKGFSRSYWLYLIAGACLATGFVDFALIAYHFQKTGSVAGPIIPIYYAIAMALGAAGALLFGKWFDRAGLSVLIVVIFISAFFAPLVFFGRTWIALCGMILWGIGMGAQNSPYDHQKKCPCPSHRDIPRGCWCLWRLRVSRAKTQRAGL